ncbi:MAG: hypothetical protein M1829_003451 [Trizodia sp. TS-e1964]|nr:MAG: hypothetical protein M1829_003451 [Trizodia sp. TS-e1964]
MIDEKELAIHPIVAESVQHNSKVISQLRNLSASVFGVAAGVLGLESYPGFLFYLLGTLLISLLTLVFLAEANPKKFFVASVDIWTSDVFSGLSSFVLTWTLFFGLVRA